MADSSGKPLKAPEDGGGRSNPTEASVLIARVRWLTGLRWLYAAMMAGLAAIAWAGRHEGIVLPAAAVGLLILAALAIVMNVGVLRSLQLLHRALADGRAGQKPDRLRATITFLTVGQLTLDAMILTAAIQFTGGARNPLAGLLVLHVAVAASLLPVRQAYLQAVLAGLLFGGLALRGAEAVWAVSTSVVVLGVLLLTVYFTTAILSRMRNINRRLVGANRALSALDLTKSRFLRISSHQLRGPLAAIHSMLSAMEAVGPMNQQQADLAGRIRQRAAEIMKQLDEMLLLSTIQESQAETADRRPVEVRQVLTEATGHFAEEASQRGLTVTVCAEEGLYVPAWEDALDTLSLHLLGNALKYTPAGGTVAAVARREGRNVLLEIADNGIGIPEDQRERVFGEFFRATNARQVADGTGLGLSIVKAIVERLGGRIEMASRLGAGTKVTVTLPAAEPPRAACPGGERLNREPNGTEPDQEHVIPGPCAPPVR